MIRCGNCQHWIVYRKRVKGGTFVHWIAYACKCICDDWARRNGISIYSADRYGATNRTSLQSALEDFGERIIVKTQLDGGEIDKMVRVSEKFPQAQNPGLLNASSISEPTQYTVASTIVRSINGDEKLVMSFKEIKEQLILNRTNMDFLASKAGDETDLWTNKRVTITPVPTTFNGKQTMGLRIVSVK